MILRELFVKLGLDVDAASFATGASAVELIKAGAEKVVEFAKDVAEHINGVAEFGIKVKELAQQSGISTDSLQRLGKAAAQEGVDLDTLTFGLTMLSKSMGAAKKGTGDQAEAFKKLGVRTKEADGKLRKTDDVFADVTESISKMQDGAEKTNLVRSIFGRSGRQFIPLLNEGKEGLEEFNKSAVMTPAQIESSTKIIKYQRQLTAITSSLWKQAIAPLLPRIEQLYKKFVEWKKTELPTWVGRLNTAIGVLVTGAELLQRGFLNLSKNAGLIKFALIGLIAYFVLTNAAAVGAAIAAGAAWALALLPVIAIVAALALVYAAFDDIRVFMTGGNSAIGEFIDKVFGKGESAEVVKELKAAWDTVSTALSSVWEWLKKITSGELVKELKTVAHLVAAPFKLAAKAGGYLGDLGAKIDNSAAMDDMDKGNTILKTAAQFNAEKTEKYQGIQANQAEDSRIAAGAAGPEFRPNTLQSGPRVQNVTINANQAPGMSNDEFVDKVSDKIREHHDSVMEEAGAVASPVPYSP